MATFQNKPNNFSAFTNDYKDAPNKPDFKGSFTDASGKVYEVAIWMEDIGNGRYKLSGRMSEPREKRQAPAPQAQQSRPVQQAQPQQQLPPRKLQIPGENPFDRPNELQPQDEDLPF